MVWGTAFLSTGFVVANELDFCVWIFGLQSNQRRYGQFVFVFIAASLAACSGFCRGLCYLGIYLPGDPLCY